MALLGEESKPALEQTDTGATMPATATAAAAAAAQAGAPAALAAPPCPHCAAKRKTLLQDRRFSCLCLALWGITSIKSALNTPLLAKHNVQSLVGAAASECAVLLPPLP